MEAVTEQTVICPVCRRGADRDHRDIVHEEHDYHEDRQTQPTVGDDLIDLVGGRELSLLLILINAVDDLANIDVTLVGDDRLGVIVIFFLNSLDILFDMIEGLLAQAELLQDLIIALKDLDRVPSLLLLGHIMNAGFFDMRDRMLDRSVKGMLGDGFFLLRRFDCFFGGVHYALALQSGDRDDLAAQLSAQLRGVDPDACFLDNVHHIDGDDDGDTELAELGSQIQVAL